MRHQARSISRSGKRYQAVPSTAPVIPFAPINLNLADAYAGVNVPILDPTAAIKTGLIGGALSAPTANAFAPIQAGLADAHANSNTPVAVTPSVATPRATAPMDINKLASQYALINTPNEAEGRAKFYGQFTQAPNDQYGFAALAKVPAYYFQAQEMANADEFNRRKAEALGQMMAGTQVAQAEAAKAKELRDEHAAGIGSVFQLIGIAQKMSETDPNKSAMLMEGANNMLESLKQANPYSAKTLANISLNSHGLEYQASDGKTAFIPIANIGAFARWAGENYYGVDPEKYAKGNFALSEEQTAGKTAPDINLSEIIASGLGFESQKPKRDITAEIAKGKIALASSIAENKLAVAYAKNYGSGEDKKQQQINNLLGRIEAAEQNNLPSTMVASLNELKKLSPGTYNTVVSDINARREKSIANSNAEVSFANPLTWGRKLGIGLGDKKYVPMYNGQPQQQQQPPFNAAQQPQEKDLNYFRLKTQGR